MQESYREIVERLRGTFLLGGSAQDANMHETLDGVLAHMRDSHSVVFDKPEPVDFAAAQQQRCGDSTRHAADVIAELRSRLSGCPIAGHPQSQMNVIPPPTMASVVGGLLPSLLNANLASEESAGRLAQVELEVVSMTADLVGYEPSAARGAFTFGGTGTLLYAVKIGIEKAFPGSSRMGLKELPVIVSSERAHYACKTAAAWLGLGEDNVIEIPAGPDYSIRPCLLESMCRDLLREGRKIAAIIATVGTTDAFGLDDLAAIADVRERLVDEFSLDYVPHLHADAVIGWAWSVFNDYDFTINPLQFDAATAAHLAATQRRVRHLALADSLGIDFHKTGFTAYSSSLFLSRSSDDLKGLQRDPSAIPYLFQSGTYHPALFTLETSRSAAGPIAAFANLLLFGKDGLCALLGNAVSLAADVRLRLKEHPRVRIMNPDNHGPVTLFRVYPPDANLQAVLRGEFSSSDLREQFQFVNEFNKRLFGLLQQEARDGRGIALSLTECCAETDFGEPILAIKSYVLSPFAPDGSAELLIAMLDRCLAAC